MLALMVFITLNAPGGHEIVLNTDSIVAMRAGEGGDQNKLVTGDVHCAITTYDGKLVNVIETCEEVQELIKKEEAK